MVRDFYQGVVAFDAQADVDREVFIVPDVADELLVRQLCEGNCPGEQLPKNDSEGVDVARAVEGLSSQNLRRHPGRNGRAVSVAFLHLRAKTRESEVAEFDLLEVVVELVSLRECLRT
mgnify:CR=1 FL=1